MNSPGSSGFGETLCSTDREDAEGGRTSVLSGSVSDSPMGTGGSSDKRLVGNTLSVSGIELSLSLAPAGGAVMSVASVAGGRRM